MPRIEGCAAVMFVLFVLGAIINLIIIPTASFIWDSGLWALGEGFLRGFRFVFLWLHLIGLGYTGELDNTNPGDWAGVMLGLLLFFCSGLAIFGGEINGKSS